MKKETENNLTKSPRSPELVALAVYLLGGDRQPVDTEDVAVKAFAMAPNRFAWKKYPEQINLELVRVSLSDAKKDKNGALLIGSGREGWTLSRKGADWVRLYGESLMKEKLDWDKGQGTAGSIDSVRLRREEARIFATQAWRGWIENRDAITVDQAAEVFRIDTYATGRLRELKIVRLQGMFEQNPDVHTFLTAMAQLLDSKGNRE